MYQDPFSNEEAERASEAIRAMAMYLISQLEWEEQEPFFSADDNCWMF
jgi:hypothetical protein